MAKMRVHELAKELDIKSADIVKALGEKGIDVKAASSIDDDNIEFVKTKFKNSQKESSGEATEDEKKENLLQFRFLEEQISAGIFQE